MSVPTPDEDPIGVGDPAVMPPRLGAPVPGAAVADGARSASRDDGPLILLGPRAVLRVPAVLLLSAALTLLLLAAVTATATLGLGPVWPWVAGALVLAVIAAWGRSLPRLDWLIPAQLRALEYGTVLLLAGTGPWGYALLATLALRHHEIIHRVRLLGTAPPRWLALVTGGWPVRGALLVLAAALGFGEPMAAALTVLLAPVLVAEVLVRWLVHVR